MRKTILVTGLHGYIGTKFFQKAICRFNILDLNRRGLSFNKRDYIKTIKGNLTLEKDLISIFKNEKFDTVLNLAAKTHIDRCEKDKSEGVAGETWKINVTTLKNLSNLCNYYGKKLIHLSTECVFDGKKGNYTEEDMPNPINWYGETKLAGEKEIARETTDYTIIRSVLAYGHNEFYPCDFYRTVKQKILSGEKITAVNDQQISFTYIDDLADAIINFMTDGNTGLYHFAGPDSLTPYDLALEIQNEMNIPTTVIKPVSLKSFFGKNAHLRLQNSTLSSKKYTKETKNQPGSVYKVLKYLSKT